MRVNKIFFKRNLVIGVQFVPKDGGDAVTIHVKEIILSAGALHSPQILMLSGISPAKSLEEAGIPVKIELPGVGRNLQNHPSGSSVQFRCKSPNTYLIQ